MELNNKNLNGNQLKLVAVISMLIDHIGLVIIGCGILPRLFVSAAEYRRWYFIYIVMRSVGRMAFPIYAYLLVEGWIHTRSWKRYALRLGVFAVFSEPLFDMMATGQLIAWQTQNVYFTLLFGLLMMKAMEHIERVSHSEPERSNPEAVMLMQLAVIGLGCIAAWAIRSDYGYIGIILIAIFYWFRGMPGKQCLIGFVWCAWAFQKWYYISGLLPAFLALYFYNGRRGSGRWKYGFYAFYPLHMLVLVIMLQTIFGRN